MSSDDTFYVEIQGPSGTELIECPMAETFPKAEPVPWTVQHLSRVRRMMQAAGYEQAAPVSEGALIAFAPRVEPDELRDDLPRLNDHDAKLSLLLSLGVASNIHATPRGYRGTITDHGSGRTYSVKVEDEQ